MKNKPFSQKTIFIGVLVIAVAIIFILALPSIQPPIPPAITTTTTVTTTTVVPTVITPKTGTLLVAVKDVKQKLSGLGQATSLIITIKSIQVHKAGSNVTDENVTAEGWITIFSGTKTLDLLDYTDVKAIIGEKELEAGKYTQIRLYMENATIKIYNSEMYIHNKTYQMTVAGSGNLEVPSKVLKLNHPFTVEEDKTISLTLDFDVPQSVARAGTGYFLKPVIGIVEEKLEKGQRPANSMVL